MKTTLNKPSSLSKISKKEVQEFQELWEKAQKELSQKAQTTEDKLFADFLTNNYLDSKSKLITNKKIKESSLVSC